FHHLGYADGNRRSTCFDLFVGASRTRRQIYETRDRSRHQSTSNKPFALVSLRRIISAASLRHCFPLVRLSLLRRRCSDLPLTQLLHSLAQLRYRKRIGPAKLDHLLLRPPH